MSTGKLSERRLLRGTIRNYRVQRTTEDFFFDDSERKWMAATGVVASAMGLLGAGAGLLAQSGDTYEEADLAEFEIDGESVQAFLWLSPFREGDEVEVVAERVSDGVWKAFGITRPADRIIALHPHCSRGTRAHWKIVAKWWWWITLALWGFTCLMILIVGFFIDGNFNWKRELHTLFIATAGGWERLFCCQCDHRLEHWPQISRLHPHGRDRVPAPRLA